ncbi:DUF3717 domain-containing protein [Limnobacter humi]|uniref:DUF3717 domain-containing protein n=1 Tax=Limnobacter humi TaxID=1778671 RepID=A0ABT1WI30_9BURK|nr:DUF3717 domain-containing protein [Limnobacter humi]MCQ8896079.1 DUF3717 domain-containing protein [Limnobacter humi]
MRLIDQSRKIGHKIYCIYSQLFGTLNNPSDSIQVNSMASQSTNDRRTSVITITELENAINWWRSKNPAPRDSMTLCKEAAVLAEVYAQWIWESRHCHAFEAMTPEQQTLMEEAQRATGTPSDSGSTLAKAA